MGVATSRIEETRLVDRVHMKFIRDNQRLRLENKALLRELKIHRAIAQKTDPHAMRAANRERKKKAEEERRVVEREIYQRIFL